MHAHTEAASCVGARVTHAVVLKGASAGNQPGAATATARSCLPVQAMPYKQVLGDGEGTSLTPTMPYSSCSATFHARFKSCACTTS